MAISYPLALPAITRGFMRVVFRQLSSVGVSSSPFSKEQQVYVHQGECWGADAVYAPLKVRADAEDVIGWLAALNGQEGTLLLGDPVYTTVRGTWSGGTPLVNGASQTGKTLAIDGVGASATVKRGDKFQLGSGASTRLHMVTADGTANGSGQITLDIWPRLRASPGDNDPLTISSPKGLFRLASNVRDWSVELAQVYGISFSCVEAL